MSTTFREERDETNNGFAINYLEIDIKQFALNPKSIGVKYSLIV